MHAVKRPHHLNAPKQMRTLGDAIGSIAYDWSQLPPKLRNKESKNELSIRHAAYAASDLLGRKSDWAGIPLRKLIGLDSVLYEYAIKDGIKRRAASYYARGIRKILAHAGSHGWTCRKMELLKSWEPAIAAFRGNTRGCLQIIEELISRSKTPTTMTEKDLQNWSQKAEAGGLEICSIEQYISYFRGILRAANLQEMFPHLDLVSKGRVRYGDPISTLTPGAQAELRKIAKRRTAAWIPDRSTSEIARPVSISKIYGSFSRLHGHRTQICRKDAVASLLDLVTPENVLPYIDFLENDLHYLREVILDTLAPILSVVRRDPLFKGHDYEWIAERIQKVPKERHYKLVLRKEEKAQSYDVLGEVPEGLRRDSENPGLSAEEVAWFRHDEALISFIYELALRQRNVRECRALGAVDPNLVWEPLDNKMLLDLYVPECVLRAYDDNNSRDFLMVSFDESETKSNRAETVVLSLALASVIEDFNDHYRERCIEDFIKRHREKCIEEFVERHGRDPEAGEIPQEELDHGHLFLNRRGGPLSQQSLGWNVRRLTRKYIGHKVSPHIWRDSFALHTKMLAALGLGGGRKMLQRRLFHVDEPTTDRYSRLGYALPGIAAIDREYSTAA